MNGDVHKDPFAPPAPSMEQDLDDAERTWFARPSRRPSLRPMPVSHAPMPPRPALPFVDDPIESRWFR